jgi:hypothetical protein
LLGFSNFINPNKFEEVFIMDDKEKVDVLVSKFREANVRLGWSNDVGLAIEALMGDCYDVYYVASRFEVTEEHAKKIVGIVNDFLKELEESEIEHAKIVEKDGERYIDPMEDGQEDQLWLGKIREIMKAAYLEASEVAVDYLSAYDIEELDSANDFKDRFTPDQGKSINTIATVAWQMLIAAHEQEGLLDEEHRDSDFFQAVSQQIDIAHFG